MKQGRKLTIAVRKHVTKPVGRVADWQISKKETHLWTVVHRITGQLKQILAP